MTDQQFVAFMALLMCSDPWPTQNPEDRVTLDSVADDEARKRGYENWVVAYFEFKP